METLVADTTNFPILGEPLPVELANTLYSHASGAIDFLDKRRLIVSWFAQAPAASGLALPRRITDVQSEAVRDLRDAARGILSAKLASDSGNAPTEIAILNKYAARASARSRLEWVDGARPRSTVVYTGGRFDVFIAQLATDCITFVAGPGLTHVRRCAHPDCEMFFLQQHRTRRFCHESCAHRARQARYYLTTVNARGAGLTRPARGGAS